MYSARFSRWNERRPGFGAATETASNCPSSDTATSSSTSSPGRRAPGGGIIPSRNFDTTFSANAGDPAADPASNPESVMFPVRIRSLWHTMQ